MKSNKIPPILFVPGALSGSSIWRNNFMVFFEDMGFQVDTVDFPSYGTRGIKRQALTLGSYRRSVLEKIQSFAVLPIVIAHSLGGLVMQQVMYQAPISAVALLSPVPPDGVLRSMISIARRSPVSAAKMVAAITDARVTRMAEAPLGMYSDTSDPQGAIDATANLRSESLLALIQALRQPLSRSDAPTPLHFFGATGDLIIPSHEVERAAKIYGAPVTIYEGMSHVFQVESRWQDIAADIFAWLKSENIVDANSVKITKAC